MQTARRPLGDRIEATVERVRRILDKGQVARTVMLYTTLYMTYDSYRWAVAFVASSPRPGIELAAIIGAVLAAVSGLQGYVFKAYIDGRPCNDAH
jgi:hypothetical protein